MILQIVAVREEESQSLTLVGNPYFDGKVTDVSEVRVAIPKEDLYATTKKLGMPFLPENLIGIDMAVAMDGRKVFLLIDLKADCFLSDEKNKREIMGSIVEVYEYDQNTTNFIIWTSNDGRCVSCTCNTEHIHNIEKIFGYDSPAHFWNDPAFYSYQNRRAYIGVRIK